MKLNSKQLNRVSEIFANLGILFIATLVIPAIINKQIDIYLTLSGIIIAGYAFYVSLTILKRK